MTGVKQANDNIDAFVSAGGDGNLVTVMMMPDERAWRFTDIEPDAARQFAKRLLRAAHLAERNAKAAPARSQ